MLKEICKRDGRIVAFKPEKITEAIFKAAQAVGGEDRRLAEKLTEQVIETLEKNKIEGLIPAVEDIQDVVEKVLIENGHARTAKAYILYRDKRTRIREAKSELMEVVKDILLETGERGNDSSWSPQKKMQQIAVAVSKKYYLDNLLSPEIVKLYNEGQVYFYGLPYYSKAPASAFLDLLELKVAAYKHNIFELALEAGQFIRNMQLELHEELTLVNFDSSFSKYLLHNKAPVTESNLTYAIEIFMQSLTDGKDSPILPISFNIGLNTSAAGRIVSAALLSSLKSYSNITVVFQSDKKTNRSPASANYDLYLQALKMAREGKNVYFSFQDSSFNADVIAAYSPGGQRVCLNTIPNWGSVAALCINLPMLAYYKQNVDLFLVELDRLLRTAVLQLIHCLEVLSHLKAKDLPLLMDKQLSHASCLQKDDNIGRVLRRGSLDIRFYGLKECIFILTGCKDLGEPALLHLSQKLADHIARRVEQFRNEFNLCFSLSAAPGKAASQYFDKKNREFMPEKTGDDLPGSKATSGISKWDSLIHASFTGGHLSLLNAEKRTVDLEAALQEAAALNLGLVRVGRK